MNRNAGLVFALVLLAVITDNGHSVAAKNPPNVIFIVADDIGWNDVSWNNPWMITPNLEKLARTGVILNQSYVQQICSPSRAAFLTGIYPFHMGLQHSVIRNAEPSGVPLNLTLLPGLLKHANYSTHIVGKWHLGYCKWDYTPTYRGFDTFFGYYNAHETYYDHISGHIERMPGLDLRDGVKPATSYQGQYSTHMYAERASSIIKQHKKDQPLFMYLAFQAAHFPLEVPTKYSEMCKSIQHIQRRIFCGMVTALDEAVGNVTNALQDAGMLDDTVIIFTTDNGGSVVQGGNNWPLRGSKSTIWEGGTRGAAFVNYRKMQSPPRVSSALVHAIDWVPTILSIAGVDPSRFLNYSLDGVDQWPSINSLAAAPRVEFIYNIDDINQYAGIRMGNYKLIIGNPGVFNDWYPPQTFTLNSAAVDESEFEIARANEMRSRWRSTWFTDITNTTQLFDLVADPLEKNEISAQYPVLVSRMLDRLQTYVKTAVPAISLPPVQQANPKYWNGTYTPGWC